MIPRIVFVHKKSATRLSARGSLLLAGLLCMLAAAIFGLPSGAQADTLPIEPMHSAPIPRAVGVYITERGLKYFSNNLLDLAARHGIELGEGNFDSFAYQADEPIILDKLPTDMIPFVGTLGSFRKIIKTWLINAEVGDPLIHADILNVSYSAQPSHFGLHIDAEATRRLSKDRGVIFNFQAEIPKVRIEAETVKGQDANNAFLAPIEVSHLWTDILPQSVPLRVTLPISLRLDDAGGIQIEILGLQSNIADIDLRFGFKRPMSLPVVNIKINGIPVKLNQARLEEELLKLKSPLLKAAQTYLSTYLVENGPAALNKQLNQKYSNRFLSDVNEMDPPGSDLPTTPSERYKWGVTPEEIHLSSDHLMLGLSGFVDDPLAKDPLAEVSTRQVTRPPVLNLINPTTYDAAITINEDLVNRILGLGYQRGYFPVLEVAGGNPLKVLKAPEFHFFNNGDQGKLHIKVRHRVGSFEEALAIHKQVTFEMDVNARLVHTLEGQVSVVVDSVDTASLMIDFSSVKRLFRNMVRKALMKELTETNAGLAKAPKVIVDSLPIPSQFGGIPIKVKDFRADPNGYLVLYTEYDLGR